MARSENMRPGLIQLLEQSSVYAHRTSAPHPEIYSYRTVVLTGTTYKILSVIREAGLDFTGRTNFLAHHLVFEPGEPLGINSPAEILLFWDGWKSSWEGEPESLPPISVPLVQTLEPPSKNWESLMGDAALAASPYAFSAGCWWISGRLEETKVLILMGESLRLSATIDELWSRSFTTYLGQILDPQQYSWKGWNGQDPRIAPAMNQKAELYLDNPQSLPEGPTNEKNKAKNGLPTIAKGEESSAKTNTYKKIGLKELSRAQTQEKFKNSSLPSIQGQGGAVSRETLPVSYNSEKKNRRRLGIIAVVMFSALSLGGASLCLYYKSEEAKQRQAEENNKKIQERRFWSDVKDNIKTLTFPRPYYEDQTKIIDILKDEQHTAQNSQKLEEATVLIIKTKPYLDNELKSVLDAYKQIVHEEDKIAEEKKKLDALKSIELRKPDGESDKGKTAQPQQVARPGEQNETKVLKDLSPAQPSPRQCLLSEIIKVITTNTIAPLIPDDIPIDTIIQPGDSSASFNKIEMLHASGSQKRIKTDLKDYTFDAKERDNRLIFINFPPENEVWFGLSKDDKTNSLIFIIPKSIPPIDIDAENKKKLGQIIEQASVIVGDSTNIQINGTAFDLAELRQENSETILKKYKDKVRNDASNSILNICKKSPNRINQTEVFKRSAHSKATNFSEINSFAKGWLKDGDDLIPRNNPKWRTGTNVFEISSLKDIGTAERLKMAFPDRFNGTNKSSFSVYRASAQELINQERAEYFLLPINEDLDQISSKDFSQKYEISKEDLKNAEAIKEYKRKIDDNETQLKQDEQRKEYEIKIWSSRSADAHILQFNVKGE